MDQMPMDFTHVGLGFHEPRYAPLGNTFLNTGDLLASLEDHLEPIPLYIPRYTSFEDMPTAMKRSKSFDCLLHTENLPAMYATDLTQQPVRAQPIASDYAQQAVWGPVLPPSACPSPAMSTYPSPAMSAYPSPAMPLAMLEMQKAAAPLPERTDVASAHYTAVQHQQKTPKSVATPTQAFTTLMFRNLPNSYTRDMLIGLLDKEGFSGHYDLVNVPVDFMKLAGLGYAFVNFTSNEAAAKARQAFQGFADWNNASRKVCEVSWSGPLQGLSAHIEHYRNSPVMHECVPECYKPVLFQGGLLRPFPHPTKEIQTPHMKRRGFHHK